MCVGLSSWTQGTSGPAAGNRSRADHLGLFQTHPDKPNYFRIHTKGDGCKQLLPGLHGVRPHLFLPAKNTTMAEKGKKKTILQFECDSNNHRHKPFLHRQRRIFFILSQHRKFLFTKINNKTYNCIRSVLLGFLQVLHMFYLLLKPTLIYFFLSEGHRSDLLTVTVVLRRWEESPDYSFLYTSECILILFNLTELLFVSYISHRK